MFRGTPVSNSVYQGGAGALELSLRFSHLDLSDKSIDGGEMDIATLGLSWWLSSKFMLSLNARNISNHKQDIRSNTNVLASRVVLIL